MCPFPQGFRFNEISRQLYISQIVWIFRSNEHLKYVGYLECIKASSWAGSRISLKVLIDEFSKLSLVNSIARGEEWAQNLPKSSHAALFLELKGSCTFAVSHFNESSASLQHHFLWEITLPLFQSFQALRLVLIKIEGSFIPWRCNPLLLVAYRSSSSELWRSIMIPNYKGDLALSHEWPYHSAPHLDTTSYYLLDIASGPSFFLPKSTSFLPPGSALTNFIWVTYPTHILCQARHKRTVRLILLHTTLQMENSGM